MFGDMLHGGCLLLLGLYLCRYKLTGDWKPLVDVRYMILLMGLFAFYNGIIYNDFGGVQLNLFGSCYSLDDQLLLPPPGTTIYYHKECTYSFGIDPAWQGELAFVNSFKMKLSVIVAYSLYPYFG